MVTLMRFSDPSGDTETGAILEATSLIDISTPSGDRFFYRVGKRRTEETINAMYKAETQLDLVLETVDKLFVSSVASSPIRSMPLERAVSPKDPGMGRVYKVIRQLEQGQSLHN